MPALTSQSLASSLGVTHETVIAAYMEIKSRIATAANWTVIGGTTITVHNPAATGTNPQFSLNNISKSLACAIASKLGKLTNINTILTNIT
jgi:hypothetical protein